MCIRDSHYEPYGSFFCMASPGDKFHLVQSGMSGKRELDVIMRDTLVQNDGERMKEDMAYICLLYTSRCV